MPMTASSSSISAARSPSSSPAACASCTSTARSTPTNRVDDAFLADFAPRRSSSPAARPRSSPSRRADAARSDLHPRRADPRHLLRPAGDDAPARRHGRSAATAPPNSAAPSSPRRRRRCRFSTAGSATGPRGGLDEPRRPCQPPRPRLLGDRHLAQRALRHHRRPDAPLLRGAVPPGGAPHRRTARESYENFTDLAGFTGDWTMAAYHDEAIASDPRARSATPR